MNDDDDDLTSEEEAAEAYQRALRRMGQNPEEDAFARMQNMLNIKDRENTDAEISRTVNISLSTEERVMIYNEVLGALRNGEPDHQIAQKVIGILNTHINGKMAAARKRKQGKSPIFRRVDE